MDNFKNINKEYKEELLNLLEEWVSIPSIYDEATANENMPFGQPVTEALTWFEKLGKNNDFKVGNVDNHAVYIEYGEGDEYVDVFGHCDVVNVCDKWTSNPFELKVNNDKLIGRGVSDNKGPMIACFLALKLIRESNINLKRKVRVIVGGNEESGFRCIKHYYSKEPYGVYGFTPDAKFPVLNGEKGAGTIYLNLNIENKDLIVNGGLEHNTIPNKVIIKNKKHQDETVIEGIGGHSSKPQNAKNPIPKALLVLKELLDEKWITDLYQMINEDNIDGNLFGINKEGKCGILSMVPTVIDIRDGKIKVIINVRFPETVRFEQILDNIRRVIDKSNMNKFTVSGKELKKSSYIHEESKLVKNLHEIYIKYSNDTNSKVRVTSAGSYASEMNNAVIYGCEFLDGTFGNIHQSDEFASLEKLNLAISIYAEAIVTLCNKI